MKYLGTVLLFFVCALAYEVGPLAQMAEGLGSIGNVMHLGNIIYSNPHLKDFEKRYFTDPADKQVTSLNQLAFAAEQMRKNVKNDFPFAGYSSLDPSLVNRFTKENFENTKFRKIGSLLDELKHNKDVTYPEIPVMDPSLIADVKLSIKEIDKAKINNDLRFPQATMFTRPFEDGKEDITKLNTRINDLAANIRKPLTAPEPTQEEIAALRRLDEKMEMISKRIHSLPSPAMEEHVLVQSQMLSGLADLLRRMTNAVEDENKEAFLYQIHALLHRHSLHDQPYIEEFEHDLARAIATGNRFDTRDIRVPAPYTAGPSSSPYQNTAYENARYQALKSRNIGEANRARNVASEMRGYGQEVVDKSKEMKYRAQMLERQQAVPAGNSYDIAARLKASTY